MDFGVTKSQKEIQKAAREFAKGEFDKETCLELEAASRFPDKAWKKAGQLGFIGMHYPEKFLGQNLGMMENVIVVEEFCKKDSTLGSALSLSGYGAECIDMYGSESLKERFLPDVAEANIKSTVAFREPDCGFDLSGIRTTARLDNDHYIVSGEKCAVINGGEAGVYVVLCTGEQGENLILVEGDRDGVMVRDTGEKLGMRMTRTADVHFQDVRVPKGNLLGKEGEGLVMARAFQVVSRIVLSAQAVGMAQGALDRTVGYIRERVQFNRRIAQFQISRHKIAGISTALEQARLMTYYAAWNYDSGNVDPKLSAMAKNASTRMAVQTGAEAIQLFGGYGFVDEYEVESFYRDAKMAEVIEGNPGFQKDLIGTAVIGRLK